MHGRQAWATLRAGGARCRHTARARSADGRSCAACRPACRRAGQGAGPGHPGALCQHRARRQAGAGHGWVRGVWGLATGGAGHEWGWPWVGLATGGCGAQGWGSQAFVRAVRSARVHSCTMCGVMRNEHSGCLRMRRGSCQRELWLSHPVRFFFMQAASRCLGCTRPSSQRQRQQQQRQQRQQQHLQCHRHHSLQHPHSNSQRSQRSSSSSSNSRRSSSRRSWMPVHQPLQLPLQQRCPHRQPQPPLPPLRALAPPPRLRRRPPTRIPLWRCLGAGCTCSRAPPRRLPTAAPALVAQAPRTTRSSTSLRRTCGGPWPARRRSAPSRRAAT